MLLDRSHVSFQSIHGHRLVQFFKDLSQNCLLSYTLSNSALGDLTDQVLHDWVLLVYFLRCENDNFKLVPQLDDIVGHIIHISIND